MERLFIKYRTITLLLLTCLFHLPAVEAQDYIANVQHFGLKEGLSHREIFAVHQDSRGFIWLGTKYGLNRFDGREFKWWTKEKQGLASNEINHILEDAEGYLWVLTVPSWYHSNNPTHISLVDIHSGKVLSLKQKFGAELPFSEEDILKILSNKDHTLFISTKKGAFYSYHASRGFREIAGSFNMDFHPLLCTSENTLWGYTSPGHMEVSKLVEIDSLGQVLQSHKQKSDVEFIDILGIDPHGQLWYSTFGDKRHPELFRLRESHQTIRQTYLPVNLGAATDWSQRLFYRSGDHSFWFKSSPHFFVFQPEKGIIYDFEKQHREIIDADIHTVFFDKEGIAWLGTANGLYQVELTPNPFTGYLNMAYDQYQVSQAFSCRGIWEEDGKLWVNTYKGRVVIEEDNKVAQHLPFIPVTKKDGRQTLLMYYPNALFQDQTGSFWFSDFTLVRRNPPTGTESYFYPEKEFTNENPIWSIYEDARGQIWFGSERGLGIGDSGYR